MANVVVLHSALGLRPSVTKAATMLAARGHAAHSPDLFDGRVYDGYEEAMQALRELGVAQLVERARHAVEELPANLVYLGFSAGASLAELLAATRPGAQGAVLVHGADALSELGLGVWPAGVPVQVHYSSRDPWVDSEAIGALENAVAATGSEVQVFDYLVDGHLFADEGMADYNPDAAARMWMRIGDFLETDDSRG
jgi:dienelactone hydrolase